MLTKQRSVAFLLGMLAVTIVSSIPAHATFPGTNGRIAFGQLSGPSGVDIFTMNPDGSDVKQLTFFGASGGSAFLGDWSPDGSELVFSQYASATAPGRLWLMNADGTDQHMLLNDPSYSANAPTFSPDGSQIVFSRCTISGFFQCAIYRVTPDGEQLTKITPINSNHDIIDFEPVYSLDGSAIAFESFWRDGLIEAVYLMNADGSGIRSLTLPQLGAHTANWSPDGRNIVFSSNDASCGCGAFVLSQEIWLISTDGHKTTRLTFNNERWHGLNTAPHDLSPSWSPQGDAIVFERDSPDGSQSAIYVMKRDGSNLKSILQVAAHRAMGLPLRNRALRRSPSNMLNLIEQSGFLPRWGPAAQGTRPQRPAIP